MRYDPSVLQPSEWLQAMGIEPLDPVRAPEAYADLYRTARRIRVARRRRIGLLPASETVGVPPSALQLAVVLGHVAQAPAAFIDANTRWPALAALAQEKQLPQVQGFAVVQASEWLHVLVPSQPQMRIDLAALAELVVRHAGAYQQLLLDLTGFEILGEHAAAFDLVDGVLLIARAGTSSEAQMMRVQAAVPPKLLMGGILLG